MDTELEVTAVSEAPVFSNVEPTETEVQDYSLIDVKEVPATDENIERVEVPEVGEERAIEEETVWPIIEEDSEEKYIKTKIQKIEEQRAARKERLKNARNIRFTLGEDTHHDFVKRESTTEAEIKELIEDTSSTAISTPTLLVSKDSSSIDLDEIVAPDLTVEDEIEDLLKYSSDDDDADKDEILQETAKGGDSVLAKTNFLDNFEIPSLSDISESDEDEILEQLKSRLSSLISSQSHKSLDPGKFVDPLTGDTLCSPSSVSTSTSKEPDLDLASSGSNIDLLEFESILTLKKDFKQEEDEDYFPQFELGLNLSDTAVETLESSLQKKDVNYVNRIVHNFLCSLIDNAVNTAENVRILYGFKNRADKFKLYDKLLDQVSAYYYEKSVNEYFNAKMVDYYRRLKNDRPYAQLSPELSEKEYQRYKEALTKLDFNLNLMASAKKKNAIYMTSVLMDLSYVRNICLRSEQSLTNIMLDTLGKKSDTIRRITERELRLMNETRNEISDTRLALITRTHTLGKITDKINKLTQINEDICIDDFIRLQNQVGALNKKIEEKNVDLKKIRLQYHSDLHLTQHCREKTQALMNKLKERQDTLKKTLDTQQALRESLYSAKLERKRIRNQSSEITYQGGLLTMPSLLYDYDETVAKVKTKQARVNKLKENLSRLTEQISAFEGRFVGSIYSGN